MNAKRRGKTMNLWIKNTDGKPDAVLTMTLLGFLTVLVRLLFSNVTLELLGKTITVGAIESGAIAAILTPTLGAYVARRYTDKKYPVEKPEQSEKVE
jgi:hypothetical protein